MPLRFTQLQAETGELRSIAREHPDIEFERFALDFHCRLVLAILETGKNRGLAKLAAIQFAEGFKQAGQGQRSIGFQPVPKDHRAWTGEIGNDVEAEAVAQAVRNTGWKPMLG